MNKELTTRALEVEKLLLDRKYEDIAFHLTHFETAEVTSETLQQTDIVRVMYRVLKSCPQGELRRRTKDLLSQWKTLYKNGCFGKSSGHHECKDIGTRIGEETSNPTPKNEQGEMTVVGISTNSHVSNQGYLNLQPNTQEHNSQQPKLCEDCVNPETLTAVEDCSLRTKSTALLCQALMDDTRCLEQAQDLAMEIEKNIFALHAGNDKKYRNCLRSKLSNLKNPNNLHLRRQIFSGDLSPQRFAQMSSMEMANQELRNLRASYTKAAIKEHQLPCGVDGVQTCKIKCQKCENFDCTVTMISRGTLFLPGWVRTGNPDEEMMTFVTCNTCGEKWYHDRWVCL
uniref:Transcription elongation factor A N-terminal and central domain containing n=1 Tax=Leptobrachium leishanense TaxID=445787 RepID=A0A8C5M229_9ANUR